MVQRFGASKPVMSMSVTIKIFGSFFVKMERERAHYG